MFEKITKVENKKVEEIIKEHHLKGNYGFFVLEDEPNKLKVSRINGRMKLNVDDIKKVDKMFDGLIDKKTSYIRDDDLYLDFNYFGSSDGSEETEVEGEDDEIPETYFYK
ncbi:hypothetical protein LCGC14_0900470 [marine sediment metagenome]|uniref:Uncharacterized protein n=1 Tax=marine sediment metagenome TaxID=412755 RepID=A0A0F9NWK4_9ZZZZ